MSHFVNKTWKVSEFHILPWVCIPTQCFKGKVNCILEPLDQDMMNMISLLWVWCNKHTILLHISHFIAKCPSKNIKHLPLPAMRMPILNDSFSPNLGSLTANDVRYHDLSKDFRAFNNGHQWLKSENLESSNNYLMHLRLSY